MLATSMRPSAHTRRQNLNINSNVINSFLFGLIVNKLLLLVHYKTNKSISYKFLMKDNQC